MTSLDLGDICSCSLMYLVTFFHVVLSLCYLLSDGTCTAHLRRHTLLHWYSLRGMYIMEGYN